jgi:hypothetical protein
MTDLHTEAAKMVFQMRFHFPFTPTQNMKHYRIVSTSISREQISGQTRVLSIKGRHGKV